MPPLLLRSCAGALLLAGLLVGCAAPGNAPSRADQPSVRPAPAGLRAARVATITIYRPDVDVDGEIHPTVALNGIDLVTPHRGTVFTTRLLPGTYHFAVDGDRAGDLKAAAGQRYYFQLIVVRGGFSARGRLGIVSPQQGGDETAHLEPIDKDDIENPAFR